MRQPIIYWKLDEVYRKLNEAKGNWMRPEDDWVRLPQGDSRTTRRQVTKERNFFFSIFRNYTCTCVCFFKFVFSKHTHTIIFYFESVRTGAHKYRLRRNSTYKEQNEQEFFFVL